MVAISGAPSKPKYGSAGAAESPLDDPHRNEDARTSQNPKFGQQSLVVQERGSSASGRLPRRSATLVHETSLRPCWSAVCSTLSTAKPWLRARRAISAKDTGCISLRGGKGAPPKVHASKPPD